MVKRLPPAIVIIAVVTLLLSGCQQGQTYPTKPIEYVSHSSAGGGSDIMARTIADIMTREKIVSQTITVVNKTGGASTVATQYMVEKKGDPHYIYNVTTAQVTAALLTENKNKGLVMSALTPVANLVMDANAFVVLASSPYKTLPELIEAAKSGKRITQGGGGVNGSENMQGFLIRKATGAPWEFVAFPSGGDAMTALLGGHVDLAIPSPAEAMEQYRAGKLRVLAVNTEKRLEMMPDVPTMKELNLPSLASLGLGRGIAMPKDVPPDTAKYWETAFQKMTQTEAWKRYVKDNALVDAWIAGQEYGSFLAKSEDSFGGLQKEMGLIK